jgi:hypothetical protein
MNFSAPLNDLRARSQFVVRATRDIVLRGILHFSEEVSNDESKSQGDFISCGPYRTADGSPGAYGESGPPQSPALQSAMLRRRADSFGFDRVALASAASLRPGGRVMPILSHTHSYFISKTQESVLSKRSDIRKLASNGHFLHNSHFAGTSTRHPSG